MEARSSWSGRDLVEPGFAGLPRVRLTREDECLESARALALVFTRQPDTRAAARGAPDRALVQTPP
jgi:hypothetical protein